jgi:hypothetical protein
MQNVHGSKRLLTRDALSTTARASMMLLDKVSSYITSPKSKRAREIPDRGRATLFVNVPHVAAIMCSFLLVIIYPPTPGSIS